MRFPTKIPTALGIMLVIALVAGVGFLFEKISRQQTVASSSTQPKDIQVASITDTSFTVTWMTEGPATGALVVSSPNQSTRTVFDERDTTGRLGKYVTHSVAVRGGKSDTEHTVKVLSNGKPFLPEGKPFGIRTGPTLPGNQTTLEPAYGIVVGADNQPAQGALVFLTVQDSQTLSAIVKPSGSWLIPLNLIRTKDLSAGLAPADRMTETLIVRYDSEESTAITDTLNDSPVPTMVLGKTYDFRKQQAKSTPAQQLADSEKPTILGLQATKPSAATAVSLTQPAQGANLTTGLPLVAGTGIPGKVVSVTLGITNPISGSTTVGSDGMWRFTPTRLLQPGKQSVTMTTVDSKGKSVALTHTFQILKSGTQVLGEATPSATIAPTAIPTMTAAPTSTLMPTPTLESTGSSTLAGQEVPTPGTVFATYCVLLVGFGLILSGIAVWKFVL